MHCPMKILLVLLSLASCAPEKQHKPIQTNGRLSQNIVIDTTEKTEDLSLHNPKLANNSILCILPLSGENQAIGNDIMISCLMLLNNYQMQSVEFFFVDSANKEQFNCIDPNNPKYKNLRAIIGPVFFDETKKISSKFQKIPIFTLSNNFKAENQHTFVCGMSPQQEIRAMLRYAICEKIKNFLLMIPNTQIGDHVLSYIKQEASALSLDEEQNFQIIRYSNMTRENATRIANNSDKQAVFTIDPILDTEQLQDIMVFTLSASALVKMEEWNHAIIAYPNDENLNSLSEKYKYFKDGSPSILAIIAYDIAKYIIQSISAGTLISAGQHSGYLGSFVIDKNLQRDFKIFRLEGAKKIPLE